MSDQLSLQEVHDFVKKAGTYYLATVEGDQPRVRPFGTIDLFEGKLYIQTGKVKDVSKQLHANPNAEISGMAEGKWIRISGKLIADERREAKKHMLDQYPGLRNRYSEDDGNTEVFFFAEATAVICSFTEEPRSLKF